MTPKLLSLVVAALLLASGLSAAEPAKPAAAAFAPGEQGKRLDEVLQPTPKGGWAEIKPDANGGAAVYALTRQALTEYWKGKPADGDRYVIQVGETLKTATRRGKTGDQFFFGNAAAFDRLVLLFGSKGAYAPGRMGKDAEAAAKEVLWGWLTTHAARVLVDPDKDWWHWGTENHHYITWGGMWGSLHILATDPAYAGRQFTDGSTVAELARGFDAYYKQFFRNRATRGVFIENGSTYLNYTVTPLYNMVDFAADPELRRLARDFLDLVWAQWALEEIGGFRGGSRHRSYMAKEAAFLTGPQQGMGWVHFGIGKRPGPHPTILLPATTSYVPSPLVQEVARRRAELGEYEIESSQIGRFGPARKELAHYVADPDHQFYGADARGGIWVIDPKCPSLVRKTYGTPDFVMGCSMVEYLPFEKWLPISAQNRRDGVLFSGGPVGEATQLFVQPYTDKGTFMNAQWSVQDRGVMLVQRLAKQRDFEDGEENETVWFSKALERVEADGWVFVRAPSAYAAVRVVDGGGTWKTEVDAKPYGERLYLNKPFSPVVIEVAPKSAYPRFENFQAEVKANRLKHEGGRLDYASARYKTTLSLHTDYSRPPAINGTAVDFRTPRGFRGGVLSSDFGGDTVTLRAFGKEQVFNFKPAP